MFKVFTTEELIVYCKSLNWTRKPKELQWHHTYKPDHKNFNGTNHIQLQENMKNYHVNTKKWSDIGQHLTLAPDGKWITGRDFNKVPASIFGRNNLGFAIEMIGNFDKGNDKLEGKQLESAITFGAFMIKFFGLTINENKFHNEYADKSCPGTGIDKKWFVGLINQKMNPPKPITVEDEISLLLTQLKNKNKINSIDYWLKIYSGRELCNPQYAKAFLTNIINGLK